MWDELVAGGGLVAVLALWWRHLSWLWALVGDFATVRVDLEEGLCMAFMVELRDNWKRMQITTRELRGDMSFFHTIKRYKLVSVDVLPQEGTIYRRGLKFMWVRRVGNSIDIVSLRGHLDLAKLVVQAVDRFNAENSNRRANRFSVTRLAGRANVKVATPGPPDPNVPMAQPATTDFVFYSPVFNPVIGVDRAEFTAITSNPKPEPLYYPESVEIMAEEMERWLNSEWWFSERGLPWRRGWLLHGVTGSGKSSLIRLMARRLNMPVFFLDLATMENNDLARAWNLAMNAVPCIVVLEDIDSVFDGRKNITGSDLSFDALLNVLSGVEHAHGSFTVMTTNHPDKLDAALVRPGRVDRRLELPSTLAREGREMVAIRIMDGYPEYWEELIEAGEEDTPAEYVERVTRVALAKFWENSSATQILKEEP